MTHNVAINLLFDSVKLQLDIFTVCSYYLIDCELRANETLNENSNITQYIPLIGNSFGFMPFSNMAQSYSPALSLFHLKP